MNTPKQTNYFFTFAPMQTRNAPAVPKTIPVILSRLMAQAYLTSHNEEILLVDCWNTVGRKIDDDYEATREARSWSREEFIAAKIQEFKDYFEQLGLPAASYDFVDTSAKSQAIIKDILLSERRRGALKHETYSSSYCPNCSIDVAPEEVGVVECGRCHTKLLTRSTEGIFWYLDAHRLTREVGIAPKFLQGQFVASTQALPHRVLINRQRDFGIQLDYLDTGDILDPKIAIALMPTIVYRETGKLPHSVTHGHGTALFPKYSALVLALNDTLPQMIAAHGLVKADLGAIYDGVSDYPLKEQDWAAFLITVLPMITLEGNVDDAAIREAFTLFRNTRTKVRNIGIFLGRNHDQLCEGDEPLTRLETRLAEIQSELETASFRQAFMAYKALMYEDISAEILPKLRDSKIGLQRYLDRVNQLSDLFLKSR